MTRESDIVRLNLREMAIMPLGILRADGRRSVKGDAVDLQHKVIRQLTVEKASGSREIANYGQAGEAFQRKFRSERVSRGRFTESCTAGAAAHLSDSSIESPCSAPSSTFVCS